MTYKDLEADCLLRMIIMRHEPFLAVEDPDFRAYQRVLNKKAFIYTKRSFKDLLRLRTLGKRAKLLEFFVIQASGQDMLHTPSATAKLLRYAAVTSDSWTSAKKETFSLQRGSNPCVRGLV